LSPCSNAGEITTGFFKIRHVLTSPQQQKAWGVVSGQNNPSPDEKGFCTQDILWALGIWSVILCLSPVIIFYMLAII